ncbi:hypothetical protein EII18_10740 [Comamonadaceae bacterium OH3737_COT-264]|nr:hypothetical protein EII18_10740 [Comamonadaceae bacterium OH3737_COT-264]
MIPITFKRNEARVDSRLIAQALGNQHKAVVQLIERYAAEMQSLGKLPFEMEPLPSGQRERFALLNEDQAFFLLTLSRNTARVVELKAKLVAAFRDARHKAELNQEYLPSYHELHSQLHVLTAGLPNERWVHANLNKLLNKAAGIKAGTRAIADVPHKALLIAAQHLATQAIRDAPDHREAYRRAKRALEPLTLPHIGG